MLGISENRVTITKKQQQKNRTTIEKGLANVGA